MTPSRAAGTRSGQMTRHLRIVRGGRGWVAGVVVGVVSVALVGCSTLTSQPAASPTSSPSQAAPGQPSNQTPGPTSELSVLDSGLLTTDVGTLSTADVTVTEFNVPQAPSLAISLSVVRNKALRDRDWNNAGSRVVRSEVVASSREVAGVRVTASRDGRAQGSAIVYHHAATNRTFPSAALIAPDRWADFVTLVAEASSSPEGARAQLADVAWPYGEGPSIGLTPEGGMVVSFPATDGGAALPAVALPSTSVASLLTPLGRQVAQAVAHPAAFVPVAHPTTPPVDLAGADEPATVEGRPSLVIGPDCARLKCVALTFDDGPSPATPELLATLRQRHVPATFFVLGAEAEKYPAVVTAEAAAGHEVGSHYQTHVRMSQRSSEQLRQQIVRARTAIQTATGQRPLLLRPPYGDRTQRVDGIVGQQQMSIVIWNVDTNDWKYDTSAPEVAQNAIVQAIGQQTTNGSIVLMHDVHATTRSSVPAVIDALDKQGYTFVTVPELGNSWQYRWGAKICRAPSTTHACGW